MLLPSTRTEGSNSSPNKEQQNVTLKQTTKFDGD
jgi:hypothetical protein